jgi:hypothetical protein
MRSIAEVIAANLPKPNRRARRHRDKVFGAGRSTPIDRAAKLAIQARAKAYNAANKRPGQHIGPLTRAYLDVLRALLWKFHNALTGRCFPSYEAIAEAANVSRATAADAIVALEAAGVLTWVNRLVRHRVPATGVLVLRRLSNGYRFLAGKAESRNPTGTLNQGSSDTYSVPKKVASTCMARIEAAAARVTAWAATKEARGNE